MAMKVQLHPDISMQVVTDYSAESTDDASGEARFFRAMVDADAGNIDYGAVRCGAGDFPEAVCNNRPNVDNPALLQPSGFAVVRFESVTGLQGAVVVSDANGRAVVTAVTGTRGRKLLEAAVQGQLVSVDMNNVAVVP